jgi:plasmid stabilization system protein ParE
MTSRVIYSERALAQLNTLHQYIAADSGANRADAFVGSIMDYCESFEIFPQRGMRRDDIRPGLRIVGFRRRVSIARGIHRGDAAIELTSPISKRRGVYESL